MPPPDPSPNSGWSETAYAAILGVQMGGTNWYRGVAKFKPLLGDPVRAIAPLHIYQALHLTRLCMLMWLGMAGLVWGLCHLSEPWVTGLLP
ncbi:cobalamin biosynthesis protein [Neosynechococcus sphagnicola]|uniref:cobalamin biosynthesis protein n=1 Tax=Neosynechococcus sphagnicola TaxID=1501145 RepID=UPI000AA3FB5D